VFTEVYFQGYKWEPKGEKERQGVGRESFTDIYPFVNFLNFRQPNPTTFGPGT
jgi:hypothetical protein